MKTIKIFLSAILMLMAITVQAQSVWIYKSDGTKVGYDASLVESVEYAQFCSIEGVTLLEDYSIDEGKHSFAESLITSVGTAIPAGASVQYGVVRSSDKTEVPPSWGDASSVVASSYGIWQVWAMVIPSTSNQGYKENIIRIGEVRISETDYGYYSLKATSKSEIKSLTEADFTKLTESTSEVPCGVTGIPVVLTEGTTAPIMTWWSNATNGWADAQTMRIGNVTTGGSEKTINGKTYNLWYIGAPTDSNDTTKIKIELK